jgi:hypothetical protein
MQCRALAPQVEEGDNAGERAERDSGSDGSDRDEPAELARCAPLGSAPDVISAEIASCVPRLPQSRAVANTELVGDDSERHTRSGRCHSTGVPAENVCLSASRRAARRRP